MKTVKLETVLNGRRDDYVALGTLIIDGVPHNAFIKIPRSIGRSMRAMAPFVKSSMKRRVFETDAQGALKIRIVRQPTPSAPATARAVGGAV